MKRATPRARGTVSAKKMPIAEVTATLKRMLDALDRSNYRAAAARGEPWPPQPWKHAHETGLDLDAADEPEPSDEAGSDPHAADPHVAALALLGQWHKPPEQDE